MVAINNRASRKIGNHETSTRRICWREQLWPRLQIARGSLAPTSEARSSAPLRAVSLAVLCGAAAAPSGQPRRGDLCARQPRPVGGKGELPQRPQPCRVWDAAPTTPLPFSSPLPQALRRPRALPHPASRPRTPQPAATARHRYPRTGRTPAPQGVPLRPSPRWQRTCSWVDAPPSTAQSPYEGSPARIRVRGPVCTTPRALRAQRPSCPARHPR